MDEPIRWGVLGAGGIAATVGADIAALPGTELYAVAARDPQRARDFAREHGVTRAHGSYAQLLADSDVDVVYLATTHGQHHEQALQIIAAGKSLLVEKAFTLNAAQAREVVEAARAAGVFCMEAMWLRFQPILRRAVELVDAGRIGSLIGVRADLSRRFEYDPAHRLFDLDLGGGALLDLGVYPLNLAWMFLGRPASVQAVGALSPTGSDVTAAVQCGYPGGAVAQLYCSAAGDSPFAALITGTGGWIAIEPRVHRATRLVVHDATGDEVIDGPPIPGNGYRYEIAEVARCLRAGLTESPVMPLDDTVAVLEVVDECRRQLGVRYPADRS